MATTREEALASKGRFGKVNIGAHFIYGQVVGVLCRGDYIQFDRGNAQKYKLKWYHREKLDLHPIKDKPVADAA